MCVFCGSSSGSDPTFRATAEQLGTTIGHLGHHLVYGGGHVGLMGVVADAAMAAGASVTGVMTEQLVALGIAHQGLATLDVQPSMHERKARMAELADGIIVLPGGYGTIEEAFELLTWNQLRLISNPVVFLDVLNFFDPLFDFIERSLSTGFMKIHHGGLARRAHEPKRAIQLACEPAPDYTPKWVG